MESVIIESIDGKYKLNKNNLLSSLRKYSENEGFVVIAVIGKNTEFLDNYLKIDRTPNIKDNWLIRNVSKGFVSETNYPKTSVLVLESRVPLQYSDESSLSQNVQDIYGLFLKFSSTLLVVFDKIIKNEEILFLEKMLISNNENNNQLKFFTNLLIVVTDWDWNNPKAPALKDQDNLFGSKCGANYLKNGFKNSKLEDYFQNVSCYLLPTRNSEFYKTYLDSLSLFHLFNIQDMPIMKDPSTNNSCNIENFIKSLEKFTNSLNEKYYEDPDYSLEAPSQVVYPNELPNQTENKIRQNINDQGSSSVRKPNYSNTEFHVNPNLSENEQSAEFSRTKRQNYNKVDAIKLCQELISRTYNTISNQVLKNQVKGQNDLIAILKVKRHDLLGRFCADYSEVNLLVFNEIEKEFNEMIEQKECEIKDQFEKHNNIKNSIDSTIDIYKDLMKDELREHFSFNKIDFTPINIELIHESSVTKSTSSIYTGFPNEDK